MTIPALLRAAAILHWMIAIGFGMFCFTAIRKLQRLILDYSDAG
jgi:hypothetical protein